MPEVAGVPYTSGQPIVPLSNHVEGEKSSAKKWVAIALLITGVVIGLLGGVGLYFGVVQSGYCYGAIAVGGALAIGGVAALIGYLKKGSIAASNAETQTHSKASSDVDNRDKEKRNFVALDSSLQPAPRTLTSPPAASVVPPGGGAGRSVHRESDQPRGFPQERERSQDAEVEPYIQSMDGFRQLLPQQPLADQLFPSAASVAPHGGAGRSVHRGSDHPRDGGQRTSGSVPEEQPVLSDAEIYAEWNRAPLHQYVPQFPRQCVLASPTEAAAAAYETGFRAENGDVRGVRHVRQMPDLNSHTNDRRIDADPRLRLNGRTGLVTPEQAEAVRAVKPYVGDEMGSLHDSALVRAALPDQLIKQPARPAIKKGTGKASHASPALAAAYVASPEPRFPAPVIAAAPAPLAAPMLQAAPQVAVLALRAAPRPYQRRYPPVSKVDTVCRGAGGTMQSVHGRAENFKDSEILSVLLPEREVHPEDVPVYWTGHMKPVIQQQATRGCTAAASMMLIFEKTGKLEKEDARYLRHTNLGDKDSIMAHIRKAGLTPKYTAFTTLDQLGELITKNGSAIVSCDPGCGGHVVMVDHLNRKSVRIRDPYHGWEIVVTREAFAKTIGKGSDAIQLEECNAPAAPIPADAALVTDYPPQEAPINMRELLKRERGRLRAEEGSRESAASPRPAVMAAGGILSPQPRAPQPSPRAEPFAEPEPFKPDQLYDS